MMIHFQCLYTNKIRDAIQEFVKLFLFDSTSYFQRFPISRIRKISYLLSTNYAFSNKFFRELISED